MLFYGRSGGILGCAATLRCPKLSARFASTILTAAPFRTPLIRHRRQSCSMPKAGTCFDRSMQIKFCTQTKREEPLLCRVSSLFMVGVTGLEPAASCSQSRRATSCATPRRQNKGRLCIVMLTHNLARNHLFFLSEKISHTLLSFRVENTILLKLLKEPSQYACGIVPTLCIII